jgi:hypothetical protein
MTGVAMETKSPRCQKSANVVGSPTIPEKVANWIAVNEHLTDLTFKWQKLETQLFVNARRQGEEIDEVCRCNPAIAKALESLDTNIAEVDQRLEALAGEIGAMKIETLGDAVAKLEVGLRIQGPEGWRPHVLELLENACAALKRLDREN